MDRPSIQGAVLEAQVTWDVVIKKLVRNEGFYKIIHTSEL